MQLENILENNLSNNLVNSNEQNKFLESTLGKAINVGLDINRRSGHKYKR